MLAPEKHIKYIKIENKLIELEIHDIPGRNAFASLLYSYKNVDAVIFVYGISNKNTFQNIKYWNKEAELNKNVYKVLVGNKCEIPYRKVSVEEGKKLADKINCNFYEVSAKNDININELFNTIVEKLFYIKINEKFNRYYNYSLFKFYKY